MYGRIRTGPAITGSAEPQLQPPRSAPVPRSSRRRGEPAGAGGATGRAFGRTDVTFVRVIGTDVAFVRCRPGAGAAGSAAGQRRVSASAKTSAMPA